MKIKMVLLVVGLTFCLAGCGATREVMSSNVKIVENVEEEVQESISSEISAKEENLNTENQDLSNDVLHNSENVGNTGGVEQVIEESPEAPSFESYQRYTNTNCNVRAGANKDTELVGTVTINTEVTVIGIEGDWSKVEYNGMQAFIKSSLLSETKTEVKQTTTNKPSSPTNTGSSQSNGGTTSQTPPPTQPTAPSGGGAAAGNPDLGGSTFGDIAGGGTSGEHAQPGLGGGK